MASSMRRRPSRGGGGPERVAENWERLVRAALKRDRAGGAGPGSSAAAGHAAGGGGVGLASAVPPSLGRTTNIEQILQAADDIEDDDPNVARILCEQAYTMAQNLDPSSGGRGVLQFKTGLASVIKQKLAKKDGASIDRQNDIEVLWNFYLEYKRRRRVDDMQREQDMMRESGTFSTEMGARAVEMKKIYATLRALLDVLEILVGQAPTDRLGRQILEEIKKIKRSDAALRGELMPYNIIPLDSASVGNVVGFFPEVRAAIAAIQNCEDLPRFPYDTPQLRQKDIFDLLQYVFGFQDDNVRNQRENVTLTLANAQSRLSLPNETEPKIDERAVTEVFCKVLDNYIKWCRFLGKRVAWTSLEAVNKNRKIILVALYFLIWGEAANVRFLPECLCYIFHNMAKELDGILDSSEAEPAKSCITSDGSTSYLEKIITPIYQTMSAEASSNNDGKAAHSAWRNYDDFNEYFWSRSCFELNWPPAEGSKFLRKPAKRKRTGKTNFVEHRTFLHLYRSFHRLWIFLILMFQCLAIIAFHDGKINLSTIKVVLSAGPAFFILNFIECCLDVLLMFGAYKTARGFAISRIVIRFIWLAAVSAFVTYLYVKVLDEENARNSDSTYFRIYVLVLGSYAVVRLVFALLAKIPACHRLSDFSDRLQFFQFFKWIYQERYYIGRGLYESISDYARYVIFWLVIFACKFTFTYFLQIRPLVVPTNIIVQLHDLEYSWHDFISVPQLYFIFWYKCVFSCCREQFDTWQLLLRARNDGRLFSNIFWPKDLEMKEQVKRLHLLLTVKDSAANIPKNLEAQRRLQFFTNSLFMDMPEAKPVSEMIPFCVFTPYYSETVLYSMSELCVDNEDGISILFYLQKIFPGNIMTLISTIIATCYPHYLFFGFEQSFSYAPCFTFVLQVLACMSNWVPSQLVNGFFPSESC
uniref:Uncharacterized protein n=1 Tax=Avena sativa TaxID=4498 RepID=A0ACD5TKV3_AVESA